MWICKNASQSDHISIGINNVSMLPHLISCLHRIRRVYTAWRYIIPCLSCTLVSWVQWEELVNCSLSDCIAPIRNHSVNYMSGHTDNSCWNLDEFNSDLLTWTVCSATSGFDQCGLDPSDREQEVIILQGWKVRLPGDGSVFLPSLLFHPVQPEQHTFLHNIYLNWRGSYFIAFSQVEISPWLSSLELTTHAYVWNLPSLKHVTSPGSPEIHAHTNTFMHSF